MSYNGSGTFQINTSGQPVVAGTVISSTAFNALTADLATGLSTAITKDGQTTTTARIPFAAGISSTLVTDSSSVSTGSIITAGGAGIAKNLYVGANANVAGTLGVTGVATFSAAPIYSSLTASSAVATDASKALVSVTNTGTGNNVLATSPTLVTPILGTPQSGTVTNLTGTASININGTVGATTANTGAFTTVLVNTTSNISAGAKIFAVGSGVGIAVGYGTGSSEYRHLYMNSGDGTLYFFNDTNFASLNAAGAWTNASDARLKKNIVDIKYGLTDVLKLQPRSYQMNSVEGNFVGFIAQELKEVVPEVVNGDPEKQLGVDYGSLVAVAFKAIQEQQALITALTARITALEAK